ncbi:MAG: hypothetical protein QG650_765, partial [Patescibacteria group bacterium]|nr:hypothetical protein [Patescibacteria group bacterium]
MRFKVNIRARLERHARGSHVFQKNGVFRIIRRFKVFSALVVLILPVYPSFASFGLADETAVGDYDESTIIAAYEDDSSVSLFSQDSGFIKPSIVLDDTRDVSGISHLLTYKVRSGDSLSVIAEKFGVSVNSIVWANDLDSSTSLRAGQTVRIPPVSGVVYSVEPKDTVQAISEKFKVSADKIAKQNGLAVTSELEIGQTLIIPGGVRLPVVKKDDPKLTSKALAKKDGAKAKISAKKPEKSSAKTPAKRYAVRYTGNGRGFAWGNCTYYVANNKNVTWRGNANQWLRNAAAAGVPTGKTPAAGAIVS